MVEVTTVVKGNMAPRRKVLVGEKVVVEVEKQRQRGTESCKSVGEVEKVCAKITPCSTA